MAGSRARSENEGSSATSPFRICSEWVAQEVPVQDHTEPALLLASQAKSTKNMHAPVAGRRRNCQIHGQPRMATASARHEPTTQAFALDGRVASRNGAHQRGRGENAPRGPAAGC